MSPPSTRIADGIMDCQVINDSFNIYTFNAPQSVNLKAGYKYALMIEGVSKLSAPNWEDIMFNNQTIKYERTNPDFQTPNPDAPMFGVKFSQIADAKGSFNGRLNYNTKQHNDTPRLTWILQTWPDPTGSSSADPSNHSSESDSSQNNTSVILSGTQRSGNSTSNDIYVFSGEASLKAGTVYTLTVSPAVPISWWENIFFDNLQIRNIKEISKSPDFVVQISPVATAKGNFSARLESQSNAHKTVSWKLEGVPADISDMKYTFATAGSFQPHVAKGYATGNLDASWFNIQVGSYALAVQDLDPSVNMFWEYLSGPGGQINFAPVNINGIAGYTVQFVIRLNGPPVGGLRGALQYGSTSVPQNVNWTLYKLDA